MALKIGNVVRLKSGGPDMTVENVSPDGVVGCTWFNEKEAYSNIFHSNVFRDTFHQDQLEAADEEEEKNDQKYSNEISTLKSDVEKLRHDFEEFKQQIEDVFSNIRRGDLGGG